MTRVYPLYHGLRTWGVPYRWRVVHRALAAALGYFWLPCAMCFDEFGGHEWRDRHGRPCQIPARGEVGPRAICPRCTAAGLGILVPQLAGGTLIEVMLQNPTVTRLT